MIINNTNQLMLVPIGPDLIQKGRSDRNGLVQQIITYVRDGKTVVRKQWVRSEFADHAKKNEEEKKDTIFHKQERHERALRHKREDENDKKDTADRRSRVKHLREDEKHTHSHGKESIDKVKHLMEQEARQHRRDEKKERRKSRKTKETRSAYGQHDQSRKDSVDQQNLSTGYTPPSKN